MRPLIAFAVATSAVAVAVAVAVAPATGGNRPNLRVTSLTPLVVVGLGFEPRERVTVVALTTVRRSRVVVHATAAGRIRVSLGRVSQPCATPFAVRAVGARSGTALARVAGRPCVPPPLE